MSDCPMCEAGIPRKEVTFKDYPEIIHTVKREFPPLDEYAKNVMGVVSVQGKPEFYFAIPKYMQKYCVVPRLNKRRSKKYWRNHVVPRLRKEMK